MTKRVLTVTMNPALDINSEADEILTGQKVRCEKPQYDPGGGGINVARVLTRLGVEVDALYYAGGVPGEFLKSLLKDEEMHDLPISINENTRENVSIIDNKTGEQYRFVFPGPHLEEKDWQEVLKRTEREISDYDFVVASGSLPPGVPADFYSRLAKIVMENGKKYVLDTSGDYLLNGIRNGASFIKPNEEEFNELKKQTESSGKEELVQHLLSLGIENIIHTLGKDGTCLYNQAGSREFIPPKIEVNSSIGAGDSFIGGLIAGLVNGEDTEGAVYNGIAAAASTLKSPGTALCSKEDVQSIRAELKAEKQ